MPAAPQGHFPTKVRVPVHPGSCVRWNSDLSREAKPAHVLTLEIGQVAGMAVNLLHLSEVKDVFLKLKTRPLLALCCFIGLPEASPVG